MAIQMKWTICACITLFSGLIGYMMATEMESNTRSLIFKALIYTVLYVVTVVGVIVMGKYIDRSLRSLPGDNTGLRRCCLLLYGLIVCLAMPSHMCNILLVSEQPHIISMVSYSFLGFLVVFSSIVVTLSLINLLWRLGVILLKAVLRKIQWSATEDKVKQCYDKSDRKHKLRATRLLISLIAASFLSMYGIHNASMPPEIKTVHISLPEFPKLMANFRIILLCDIHLGATVGLNKLQTIVDITNKLHGDAVVITGDLVDATVSKLSTAVEPLKHLKAPHGVYFVTGNHEYFNPGVDLWFSRLRDLGVRPLHNENVQLNSSIWGAGQHFCLAGVDDITASTMRYYGHGMDVDAAVRGCDVTRPIVLLAHQPKAAKEALLTTHNIQLVLSGHTHGGQMIPMTLFAWIVNPFYAGLYEYNNKYVYVSMGTVYWGIPMRMFSTSEITEIVLNRK